MSSLVEVVPQMVLRLDADPCHPRVAESFAGGLGGTGIL
jgi:hypothetical protein